MGWQLFRDREHGAVDRDEDLPALTHPDPDAVFWASPVGRATRARIRGDRFFQIELDDATIAAYAETVDSEGGGRRAKRACDLLGQIEELGWTLEHVSWWRVDDDHPITHHGSSSAHPDSDPDHVRGVYLFHSVPDVDADGSPAAGATNGVKPSPSHRRDVL